MLETQDTFFLPLVWGLDVCPCTIIENKIKEDNQP